MTVKARPHLLKRVSMNVNVHHAETQVILSAYGLAHLYQSPQPVASYVTAQLRQLTAAVEAHKRAIVEANRKPERPKPAKVAQQ